MKARTLLTLALLSLLLLTACSKGDPLPGGYAIFIPAGDDSMICKATQAGSICCPRCPRRGRPARSPAYAPGADSRWT